MTTVPEGLWGARSRPVPVTWGDRCGAAVGQMISGGLPPALPDLRSALLACPARPLAGVQERGTAGAAVRGRRAAPHQAQGPARLGRPGGPGRADPVCAETSSTPCDQAIFVYQTLIHEYAQAARGDIAFGTHRLTGNGVLPV